MKIDYAMKDKNPVDSVKFFQDYTDENSFHIDKSKVSALLPSSFIERKVRVFSKNRDPVYIEAVEEAFLEATEGFLLFGAFYLHGYLFHGFLDLFKFCFLSLFVFDVSNIGLGVVFLTDRFAWLFIVMDSLEIFLEIVEDGHFVV